jgi:hypothetical protein
LSPHVYKYICCFFPLGSNQVGNFTEFRQFPTSRWSFIYENCHGTKTGHANYIWSTKIFYKEI